MMEYRIEPRALSEEPSPCRRLLLRQSRRVSPFGPKSTARNVARLASLGIITGSYVIKSAVFVLVTTDRGRSRHPALALKSLG